ncbi:MAG: rhodanese-like domain-containing protein [Desulfobacterales bacterium]|nr:rhodanese-like domain-containing protein [Desulfobacterales bacterium]
MKQRIQMSQGLRRTVLQAVAVLLVSAGMALFFNETREDRLPLVMPFPPEYRCSSPAGAASPINTSSALAAFGKRGTIFVDARSNEEFEKGHIETAVHMPYLFVEPVAAEAIALLLKYERVIVYCNTEGAEVSSLMAGELSHSGVKDARYLEGGFLKWAEAGGKYTGQKPEGYVDLK